MGTGNRTYLIIAVVTFLIFGGNSFVFADEDVQFWQTTGVSFDVNKDWAVVVEEQLKFDNEPKHFFYHHTDLGFIYKSFENGIDLGFNYRQIFRRDDNEHWNRENRPHVNIIFKQQLGKLDVSNRSRFEYRDREDERDLWRYTHLLKVSMPFEFSKYKFRPYIADMVFLNLKGNTFGMNRIYTGVSFVPSKNMESRFFYVRQSSRSDGRWRELNAFGFSIKFRL